MKEGLDSKQVEKAELHPTLSQAGKRNTQSTHAYVKEVKKLPVETMMEDSGEGVLKPNKCGYNEFTEK